MHQAKICSTLVVAGMLSLCIASAMATCKGESISNVRPWLWNYDGMIADKYRVRFTLDIRDDRIAGVYFYASQLRDIKLTGRIIDGFRVLIDELDARGNVAARFEGEFSETDPRGKFRGKLECEVIVGYWYKVNSQEKLPFYLSWESGIGGTFENLYAVAGAQDDELIHRNARRFWEAVKGDDKRTVASLINYPVRVRSLAGGRKAIRSPSELIERYDDIFSPAYQNAIANALPRNMFVRYDGIMLGNGEVWFGPNGKVITLNN